MGWEGRRLGRGAVSDSGFADAGFSGDVSPEAETVPSLSPGAWPPSSSIAFPLPPLCPLQS